MSLCPCGTGNPLSECCAPYINGDEKPVRAEVLMRARYTAHTIGNMDFILATHHPSTRTDIDQEVDQFRREVDQFRRDIPKQGRNEICACGSGLKHKKCCGKSA